MSSEQFSASPPPASPTHCPRCGARVHKRQLRPMDAGAAAPMHCWLCGEPLAPGRATSDDDELLQRIRLPQARSDSPAFLVFGLLALLYSIGLAFEAPGVLVVLLIAAMPALIRTVIATVREHGEGTRFSGLAALGTFLSSLGIIVLTGLTAIATFYATCFAVCLGGLAVSSFNSRGPGEAILVISVGVGIIVGLAVAVLLIRKLWPRRKV